eukprot:SAG31_NODE_32901_length_350_cov_1.019920_1_plen_52_part_00
MSAMVASSQLGVSSYRYLWCVETNNIFADLDRVASVGRSISGLTRDLQHGV